MRFWTCLVLFAMIGFANSNAQESDDLMDLSLDDLLGMEVSSVSKKAESMMDVASSIYVISEDDIRRSGAARLQDALMLVPGFWSHDYNYYNTNDGIRSESDIISQSISVLVDGIPVNSPILGSFGFSWIEIPLSQIQRIEVIKGPGGTIYGANANTGIINIFTKDANNSEGFNVVAEGGTQSYVAPFISYGKKITERSNFTLFAGYKNHAGYSLNELIDNNPANKYTEDSYGREALSAGFNLQSQFGENLTNRLRGLYSSVKSNMYTNTTDNELRMMSLQAMGQDYAAFAPRLEEESISEILISDRADYTFNENHNMFAQVYFRSIGGDQVMGGTYSPNVSIFNIELQDNFLWGINNFSAGVNFSSVMYDIQNTGIDEDLNFTELDATESLYSFFIQDKINFTDWLALTVGAKAETWSLVSDDPEISPSARILVKPQDDLMFWAAASRSITTPGYAQTRLERRMISVPSDMLPKGSPQTYVAVVPGDDVQPTEYITFELGSRTTIVPGLMIDASFFYSDIKGVIDLDNSAAADPESMASSMRPSDIYGAENLIVPLFYTNMQDVKSMGGEIILKANPMENLRLELSYAMFKYDLDNDNDNYVQQSPENVIRFRPYYDIPSIGLNLSAQLVYASEYARGETYNYALQLNPRTGSDDLIPNTRDREAKSRIRLDINIEKEIMKDMLWLNVWGRNITNTDPYEADYSKYYSMAYPQVVHATFGAGLRLSIK